MNVQAVIDDVIRREGSKYTDRPTDRGGPTKYGITHTALAEWRGHPVTAKDVELLTEAEARQIYLNNYVRKPGFNLIPDDSLAALMVDSGVLHGRSRATKWLQAAIGAKQDGQLGPQTLQALSQRPPGIVYRAVLKSRVISIGKFISTDHSQAENAEGWNTRASEFI